MDVLEISTKILAVTDDFMVIGSNNISNFPIIGPWNLNNYKSQGKNIFL